MTKNLIAPLKALRVSRKYAAKTVSPPYDVVTREEAINQIKGNPYHFLRVSRAEIELSPTTDPYSSNA